MRLDGGRTGPNVPLGKGVLLTVVGGRRRWWSPGKRRQDDDAEAGGMMDASLRRLREELDRYGHPSQSVSDETVGAEELERLLARTVSLAAEAEALAWTDRRDLRQAV